MWSSRLSQLMEPPPGASASFRDPSSGRISTSVSPNASRRLRRKSQAAHQEDLPADRPSSSQAFHSGKHAFAEDTEVNRVLEFPEGCAHVWAAFAEFLRDRGSTCRSRNATSRDATLTVAALQQQLAEMKERSRHEATTDLGAVLAEIRREQEEIDEIYERIDELITVRQMLPESRSPERRANSPDIFSPRSEDSGRGKSAGPRP